MIVFCLASAFTGSALGFGGAMLLAPACFWLLPPAQAVMTLLLLSNLTNLLVVTERRQKSFDRPELRRLLLGTVPGVALGIVLLSRIDQSTAIILAGAVIILGVGLRIPSERLSISVPAWPGYPVGLSCGLMAATTGLAALAPPWLLLRRLSPSAMRDTLQLYYLLVGSGVFIAGVSLLGVSASLPDWWLLVLGALAIGAGYWLGKLVFERLKERKQLYQQVAMVVLLLVGLTCILRGLL